MIAAGLTLLEEHWQFLRSRAVAYDVATERGYQSAMRKADLHKLGFGPSQRLISALVLPIWSVRRAVESYQLRPDQPRLDKKGKPRKYEMKAGGGMLLDMHPRLTRRSKGGGVPLISDPGAPLFITEGIPKGDAAVSIGLCCLALLGVWNWRGSNTAGGKTALADWESVALNNRLVYIAFDSDVMQKAEVHKALIRLKAFLEGRGAIVKLIYLPAGGHEEKVGLDDFIACEKAAGRGDAEIRNALLALATPHLRKPPPEANDGVEIIIEPGQTPQMVDAAEKVLVINAARLHLFQRSGQIVRVIQLDSREESGGLKRPEGTVQLASVLTVYLQETLERLVRWVRIDENNGEAKPANCPARVPATYLARKVWKLPILSGVVEAPILRPDGSILSLPGYDDATGLFLCADDGWPAIPDAPTREDAEAALHELLEPFAEFPFVDGAAGAARSVLAAAILTAIQRRLLESAPLFAFDAPSQRSGKSLLAEAVGLIATGHRPPATGVSRSEEELRKAITSALLEGHAIVNLDNITHPLDSPHLARAITQSVYSDRHLGVNEMLRLPSNILWTATGNNLTFRGDMPSRTLVCRIDAGVERPEERNFRIADLPLHLMEYRKRLVVASLTALRAYHVAGRPRQYVRPWGGFDHWSREIREPLVWLGLADPCATREQLNVNDPERDSALSTLSDWSKAFGDRAMLVAEVIRHASLELREHLVMVAGERDNRAKVDARRLGTWCRSVEDRIFGDFRLSRDGSVRRATMWRVSCVSSVSPKPAGENGATHTHPVPPAGQATESVHASPSFNRREINSPNSPDSPSIQTDDDEGVDI